jgi:hypothetical protein
MNTSQNPNPQTGDPTPGRNDSDTGPRTHPADLQGQPPAAPADSATPTVRPGGTPGPAPQEQTVHPAAGSGSAGTVRLGAAAGPDRTVHPAPESDQADTVHLDRTPVSGPPSGSPLTDAVPDRVEGEVLRFGPGVPGSARTANGTTAADIWHGTLPGQPHDPRHSGKRQRGGLRRYALAAAVLIAVIAFLLWQRLGPGLAVESVTVQTDPRGPACDDTADVTGVVVTNGEPGTIEYRWLRSDGTASGTLRERLTTGQREARLHLLWTFRGRGTHEARAELRILAPGTRTASARFTYTCP